MSPKNAQSKAEREKTIYEDIFLSESDSKQNGFDDVDYIKYQEVEEADNILIPTEEIDEEDEKSIFTFSFENSASFFQSFVDFISSVGESAIKLFARVFTGILHFLKIPFMLVWQKVILQSVDFVLTKARHSFKRMRTRDFKNFKEDAVKSIKKIREARQESLWASFKEAFRNIFVSFKKHKKVWLAFCNVVFPIVCIVGLVITINHYSGYTFALQVNYNGHDIGYVENESVWEEAKEYATKKLSTGSENNVSISVPTYKVAMLTPNELSDPKTVSNKIIEYTDGDYINACGIYIDGEFVCAVKNEAYAIDVFDSILEPYAQKEGKDSIVAFVQEISYVQGFYPDNEQTIWSTDKLKEEMTSQKSGAVYHTVKDGDTPTGIASQYKMYYSDLLKLNPGLGENIHIGDKILISAQVNYIRVKVMKTETRTEKIAYETETRETDKLYKGTSKTVQKGREGKEKITEMVTYIDGVKTYATTLSTETTKKPVTEIIEKGTKAVVSNPGGSYGGGYSNYRPGNGNYSYDGGRLGSPMASSYYLSSSYGYRTLWGRSNFHRGADLCHRGGSAGIPVLAVAGGTVERVTSSNTGYGYSVLINHGNGLKTRYAHMQAGSISVRVGQKVSQGQQIGRVGKTGNASGYHLHFEVIKNGVNVNPWPYIS